MSYLDKPSFGELSHRNMLAAMTKRERLFFWLVGINFVAFVVGTFALGGDALNGFTRDGHYYLSIKGTPTEVSKGVFVYSMTHALSLCVTIPLGIMIGFRARRRARTAA